MEEQPFFLHIELGKPGNQALLKKCLFRVKRLEKQALQLEKGILRFNDVYPPIWLRTDGLGPLRRHLALGRETLKNALVLDRKKTSR